MSAIGQKVCATLAAAGAKDRRWPQIHFHLSCSNDYKIRFVITSSALSLRRNRRRARSRRRGSVTVEAALLLPLALMLMLGTWEVGPHG